MLTESLAFEWVSAELEARTALSRIEARGTLRLVLKNVGLEPASVSVHQMQVVVERLLPAALGKRRVGEASALCRELAADLVAHAQQHAEVVAESAYDVFERMDSSRRSKP
ncbi:MAG: hypothetical protein KF718_17285 [Polyangiaceae bacterium]|nr:hypothetical protein [Polyangiaceae bacterium]